MKKFFRPSDHLEYLIGNALLWFGYFACFGFLLLLAFHG